MLIYNHNTCIFLYCFIVYINKHSLVTIVLCCFQVLLHLQFECVLLLFAGGNPQVLIHSVYSIFIVFFISL